MDARKRKVTEPRGCSELTSWQTESAGSSVVRTTSIYPFPRRSPDRRTRKFLSLGAWKSQQAQERWREMPQMQVILGQARALCDEYDTHRYTLAARRARADSR